MSKYNGFYSKYCICEHELVMMVFDTCPLKCQWCEENYIAVRERPFNTAGSAKFNLGWWNLFGTVECVNILKNDIRTWKDLGHISVLPEATGRLTG